MHDPTDPQEKTQQLLTAVLRDLPARRAPGSLEARVLRELQRRVALPWWRRGFAHWPLAARAAFFATCAAVIGFTVLDGSWAITASRVLTALGSGSTWWTSVSALESAVGWTGLLVHVIPPFWLYGAMAAGALLYAALFGLGAAAYRTLYCQPSLAGHQP
jgi:hypothetical protein